MNSLLAVMSQSLKKPQALLPVFGTAVIAFLDIVPLYFATLKLRALSFHQRDLPVTATAAADPRWDYETGGHERHGTVQLGAQASIPYMPSRRPC